MYMDVEYRRKEDRLWLGREPFAPEAPRGGT